MKEFTLIATSTFGLESLVAQEVKNLGYNQVSVKNGQVTFNGDAQAICRANLWLRTADRVRLQVGQFTATTFDELFEKTKALPWADYMPVDANFPVEGKSIKSKLFSVSDCQAIVKKAVVESMKKKYKRPWYEENGPLFKIEVALLKDVATLTIDTTGPGLHKRGYRDLTGKAPLRENIAAALVQLSRWWPDTTLIDPFCGSGTIAIEAALIGKNIAPGMNRDFVSQNWPIIPIQHWRQARKETHDLANPDQPLDITGTDIDSRAVQIARRNAREAGLEDVIHWQRRPFSETSSSKKYGKIICNPPYGARIGQQQEIVSLYQQMRPVFDKLDTWSFYILTAYGDLENTLGQRASKRRKLYNGDMKVDFYQYFGPRPPRRNS